MQAAPIQGEQAFPVALGCGLVVAPALREREAVMHAGIDFEFAGAACRREQALQCFDHGRRREFVVLGAADVELAARLGSLSPQQFRVLALVAEGRLNKQIADRLGIQERTVKAHMSAIFEKLGVRNRTQAGVLLRSLELVDPASRVDEG